jgi:hypothetical protein
MSANAETVITEHPTSLPPAPRRRGRPLEMSPDEVLSRIGQLASRGELFRVHLSHPALYARARRQFGSWSAAVQRAGADYAGAVEAARRHAIATRRTRRTTGRLR